MIARVNKLIPYTCARVSTRLGAIIAASTMLAALAVLYARTLAPGVTWANDGADSGDLAAAAATLGVAHPTGYPTYLLLARLFQFLPTGDLAFRTTLLSASAALLAVLLVLLILRELLPQQDWRAGLASGIAALGFGISPVFWSQAVIAEVHTLNAFLVALILLFSIRRLLHPARRGAGLQGLVVGLALGNHITIVLPALVWLFALFLQGAGRPRMITRQLLLVAAGLLVYLYLPLRAAVQPPINWGNPVDWEGFWWVFSGEPYRELAFGLPSERLFGRVEAWAALLVQQFGLLGLALGFFGLLYGQPSSQAFIWITISLATGYSIFAVTYDTIDSYAYLVPAYLIFALWIGLGASRLLDAAARHSRAASIAAALVLTLALALPAVSTARRVDASHDRRAIDFAAAVLAMAPHQAILVTSADADTFPLWYYHHALGQRQDLILVVDPLLDFDWYRDNLRGTYPSLHVPDLSNTSPLAALAAENGGWTRICRTDLSRMPPLRCGLAE